MVFRLVQTAAEDGYKRFKKMKGKYLIINSCFILFINKSYKTSKINSLD